MTTKLLLRNISLVALASVMLGVQPPLYAANKASIYISNFKKTLTITNNQMDTLESEHEKAIDAEDAKLADLTNAANAAYDKELLSINSTYAPLLATANQKAQEAKDLFNKNNKVKVGSGGGFFGGTNLANYLDCPAPVLKAGYTYELAKRYCTNTYGYARFGDKSPTNSGAVIGGEDWQIGDETTIQLSNADQPLVQSGIANAYIVPLNLSIFDSSRIEYKNQMAQIDSLTTRQGNARTAATKARDTALAAAKAARDNAVSNIEDKYQQDLEALEATLAIQENALLAAQRASKDPNNFSQAFVVAYKFEFNRVKLNEIADMPWTGLWTFRAINTLIKVTRLADQADAISNKYSYKSALNFNNSVSGAFTNDISFRAEMKAAQALFSKATGVSVKF